MSCTSRLAPRSATLLPLAYTLLWLNLRTLFLVSFSHSIDPPVPRPTHNPGLFFLFSTRPFQAVLKNHDFFTTRSFWPAKPRFFARPVPFFLWQNRGFFTQPVPFSSRKTAGFCTTCPFFLMKKKHVFFFCTTRPFFLQQNRRVFYMTRPFSYGQTTGFFPRPVTFFLWKNRRFFAWPCHHNHGVFTRPVAFPSTKAAGFFARPVWCPA